MTIKSNSKRYHVLIWTLRLDAIFFILSGLSIFNAPDQAWTILEYYHYIAISYIFGDSLRASGSSTGILQGIVSRNSGAR